MAMVRKVQSRMTPKSPEDTGSKKVSSEVTENEVSPVEQSGKPEEGGQKVPRSKKFCHFCKTKTEPRYWDTVALRRYLSDRGRIYPRTRSGACAKHQRAIGREIKRARQLAILPFTSKLY